MVSANDLNFYGKNQQITSNRNSGKGHLKNEHQTLPISACSEAINSQHFESEIEQFGQLQLTSIVTLVISVICTSPQLVSVILIDNDRHLLLFGLSS